MSEALPTSAFYPALPTLALDGQEELALATGLLSLSVRETTDGLYNCEATFGNWGTSNGKVGFVYFDRDVLDFGRTLRVEMGNKDTEAKVFEGRIMAIEGRFPQQNPPGPEILILAEDRLQDLRMVRRSRSFAEEKVKDVITTIAKEHGLSTDIDVDEPRYKVLTQVNQTDMAFIRECARGCDAEVWIEGDKLFVQARSRRKTEELSLGFGGLLKEFSVMADLAHQRTSLSVCGWDVGAKETIEHKSDISVMQSELNGGEGGSTILEKTLGQRADKLVHHVPFSNDEAKSMANAHFRRMARRFLTGQALAEGDGRIKAGTHVQLNGLGPLFNGSYYVNEVIHSFDLNNGYRTYFRVERPYLGEN